MLVENITIHDQLSFDDYLKINRVSFSSLKDIPFKESEGSRIGKLCHTYALKPSEYRYEQADVVVPITRALISYVGIDLLRGSVCEQPVTADFVVDGFSLPWKGVPDIRVTNVVVIDLKIIKEGTLKAYCERFGYPDQCRGYMAPFNVDLGLIIAYNRKKKIVEVEPIPYDTKFWSLKTITHGQVINQNQFI